MSTNPLAVGDRVMLIPFQHKGKIATVKYYGAIEKKFGTWVGLELDEPTGDSSGEVNGEQLFECKPMHGLVLRNTQVKLYDPDAPTTTRASIAKPVAQQPGSSFIGSLTINDDFSATLGQKLQTTGLSGSPLLTPTMSLVGGQSFLDSESKLLQKVNESLATYERPTDSFIQAAGGEEKSTAKGWQARLASLKQKKAEDKKIQETSAGTDLDNEAAELRASFKPQSGIKKDEFGNLIIAQEEVKSEDKRDGEKALQQIEKQKAEQAKFLAEIEQDALNQAEKKAAVSATPKPGHNRVISNADKIKEKQKNLEEERKMRQSVVGKAPTTTTRTSTATAPGAKPNLNRTLTSTQNAASKTNLNSTLKATKDVAADKPALTRSGSNSRLGGLTARKGAEEPTTPGLKRSNSNSRLGLTERASSRAGSNTRATIRAGDGSQTAREASRDKTDLNSTLTKKVGSALNSTLNSRVSTKTPIKDTQTKPSIAAKPTLVKQATIGKSNPTPLDYKKMEALLNEKTTEIQCLQEEVQGLTERITEINSMHQSDLEMANEKQRELMQRELKKVQEQFADEKIKFQTELESLQERMMNASPESYSQEFMDKAQQQLTTIQEQSKQKQAESQDKITQLQGELDELKRELAEKQQLINELQEQVLSIQTQMQEQSQVHQVEMQELISRLQQSQGDSAVESDQKLRASLEQQRLLEQKFVEFQKQAESQRLQDIQQRDQLIKDLQKKTMEQATIISEFDVTRQEEQELHELELAQLRDEKEEILQKFMEQGKVDDVDPLADLGLEEIKTQNKKLRQAITTLTVGFEEERKKQELAFKADTTKDKKIADLQKKLEEMDFLLEEIEQKEEERAEMEKRLEEIVEYENMVEEMVSEIAKKDDIIEEITAKFAVVQEEYRLMEDLNNQFEQFNKELATEIEDKENKIQAHKSEIETLEVILLEQDTLTQKYKQTLDERNNQLKIMGDQLSEFGQDGSRDQIRKLIDRQHALVRSLREAESKQLQVARNFIELQQGRAYSDLVTQILPPGLQKEAQLEAYGRVQLLNTLRHKATLFVREICDKSLEQAKQLFEEKEQLDGYLALLQRLGVLMTSVINQCATVQFQMANSSPETYKEIVKLSAWDRIPIITAQVDTITDLLNNQSLSYTFETTDFANELKSLETLLSKVEKLFSALSPEEILQAEAEGVNQEKMMQTIQFQRRKNLAEHVSKIKLRNAALNMALGVCFVSYFSTEQSDERAVTQKCKLIYLRLLDTIMKIDHIPNEDSGDDYIDTKQLNTDLRLNQKLDSISILWLGTDSQKEEERQKSWLSTLEAIERDITMLNNDFKFKRLIRLVDQKYGNQKIDFNDIYKLDLGAQGPWLQIAQSIKTELQDMTALKQKNSQLQEKQKESMLQLITLKKDKDEAVLISLQLESKLSLALAKAEQLPAMEIEKADLEKKNSSVLKQLETAKIELDKEQKQSKDLISKLEEAKKALLERPTAPQQQEEAQVIDDGKPNIKARILARNNRNRHSRTSSTSFYKLLKESSKLPNGDKATPGGSHGRQMSQQMNNAAMMQQLQATEDSYMQIINELQYDRLQLKAKDMTQRVQKLASESTAFSTLLKQFNQVEVRLNQDECNLVQGAIKEVSKLQYGLKKRMACARVIDLTKKQAAANPPNEEQFTQKIVRAKDAVKETLELLFSKDNRFKVSDRPGTVRELPAKSQNLCEIKIGEIKLKGKIQLPQRKVVMDERQVADMRRNLALFSS